MQKCSPSVLLGHSWATKQRGDISPPPSCPTTRLGFSNCRKQLKTHCCGTASHQNPQHSIGLGLPLRHHHLQDAWTHCCCRGWMSPDGPVVRCSPKGSSLQPTGAPLLPPELGSSAWEMPRVSYPTSSSHHLPRTSFPTQDAGEGLGLPMPESWPH